MNNNNNVSSDFEKKVIAEGISKTENEKPTDKILETITELSKKREEIDSNIKVFFNNFMIILPIIIINILALFIIGLDNFIDGKWDWSTFASANFWYSYLRYQTANWLLSITYLNASLNKIKRNHEKYKFNLESIQEYVDFDHKEEFIGDQAEIETIIRKRYYLEIKISQELLKIKTKHKISNLDDFYNTSDINTLNKKEKKAHAKITVLYEMLTKEWAIENLKGYKIKYPKVTRSLLVSGFQPTRTYGRFNTYTARTVSISFRMIVPTTLIMSILMFVLLAFEPMTKEATLGTWLKFVSQIFIIIFNILMITSRAYTIFEITTLRSSEERKSDLGVFQKRHLNKNANEQYAVSILAKEIEKNEL